MVEGRGDAFLLRLRRRAEFLARVALCTLKAALYAAWPRPLGAASGGKLEVSRPGSSSSTRVKSRSSRGGAHTAMVDGSVQGDAAAIAVWYHKGHPLNFSGRISGKADNNRAELAAVFWALLCHPRAEPLTLYTDNTHVLGCMHSLAREGPENSRCLLVWGIALLLHLRVARTLLRKIKAHNQNEAHDTADALAKLSLGAEKLHNVPEGQVDSTAQRLWLLAASMWVTTGWSEFCGSLGIRVVDLPIAGLEVQRTGKAPALPTPARSLAPPAPKNDDFSKTLFLAVDCEMVGVGPGGEESALARVCIVNQHGNVLLDAFAKPEEKITDYRTRFSGIRAADLARAPPAKAVKATIAEMVKGHVLVGHGLENDLEVLGLRHPPADTRNTSKIAAFCYRHKQGRPRKLRDLAAFHLGLDIQRGEHSPVDDARAAMYLFKAYELNTIR